jgi:solute carrier family 8 (sodium/calcium exchanger)
VVLYLKALEANRDATLDVESAATSSRGEAAKKVATMSPEAIAQKIKAEQEAMIGQTSVQKRAASRREVLRTLTGRRKGNSTGTSDVELELSDAQAEEVERTCFVGFVHAAVSVTEGDDEHAELIVARTGNLGRPLTVSYATKDVSATAGSDYVAASGKLEFAAGESTLVLSIKILDDDEIEDDEEFIVELSDPTFQGEDDGSNVRLAGPKLFATATVVIHDDDVMPGTLSWKAHAVRVKESEGSVTLVVERRRGHNGEVSVQYNTVPKTALEGIDYVGMHGTITLAHGQLSESVTVEIIDDTSYEKDEHFLLVLSEPTGGAIFPADTDGRDEQDICTITIESDGDVAGKIDTVLQLLKIDRQRMSKYSDEYREQFSEALAVEEGAGAYGWAIHLLMLPWKLVFALAPPAVVADGWALFVTSLIMIGAQVIVIDEVANAVGCQWGISASLTAITLVALGTSLPDLFASMKAAQDDETADNSVGNVTGSNSVNVFLGLGLPWLVAAIYWGSVGPTADWQARYPNIYADYVNPETRRYSGGENGGFVVCAGSLAFSVVVFTVCAIIAIGAILARRFLLQPAAELGGDYRIKLITCVGFIGLWVAYLVFSIVRDIELVPSWNSIPGLSPEGSCP